MSVIKGFRQRLWSAVDFLTITCGCTRWKCQRNEDRKTCISVNILILVLYFNMFSGSRVYEKTNVYQVSSKQPSSTCTAAAVRVRGWGTCWRHRNDMYLLTVAPWSCNAEPSQSRHRLSHFVLHRSEHKSNFDTSFTFRLIYLDKGIGWPQSQTRSGREDGNPGLSGSRNSVFQPAVRHCLLTELFCIAACWGLDLRL